MLTHTTNTPSNKLFSLLAGIMKIFFLFIIIIISIDNLNSQPTNSVQLPYASKFVQRCLEIDNAQVVRSKNVLPDRASIQKKQLVNKINETQWQQVNGPFGASVRNMVHAKTGSVYLCSDGGIYRAKSLGSVWEKITIPYDFTYDLRTMFVHPNGTVFAFGAFGIYRSADDGKSWKVKSEYSDVRNVVTDSVGNMYAASYRAGLLFSSDSGLTWKTVGLADKNLLSVAITRSGKILCGSMDNLYATSNRCITWDSVNVEGMPIYSIEQCKNGSIFALGATKLFRSRDDSKTWKGNASNDYLYRFYIDENNVLYALGLFNGVQISTDGGDSWVASTLQKNDLLCMHFFGKDTIAVGLFDGVLLSTNNGKTWSRNDSGLVSYYIGSISETSTGDIIVSGMGKQYITSDNGEHWNLYSGATPMAVDMEGAMYASDSSGIIKSTNNGGSWKRLNISVAPYFISSIVVKSKYTVIAGSSTGDIYRSSDGGQNWKLVFSDNRRDFIIDLTIDKNGNIYCGTSTEILKSTDDGVSWQEINKGSIQSLVTNIYSCANSIFVGTMNSGIYRSTDGGTTWKSFNNALSNENIKSITSDRNGNLYTSTCAGVYKSTDMGVQWNSISEGLRLYVCNQVFVSSKGFIFLGTQQDGLYRTTSPIFQIDPSLMDVKYQLFPNYPNPFNPSTAITFSITKQTFVTLKIYDAIGREVATIVSEELPVGIYSRHWQAYGLPSGVYFYRLQTDGFSETKRMVLLR